MLCKRNIMRLAVSNIQLLPLPHFPLPPLLLPLASHLMMCCTTPCAYNAPHLATCCASTASCASQSVASTRCHRSTSNLHHPPPSPNTLPT